MPLMGNWSDALIEALDRYETSLAGAVGLRPGMSGEEFEGALGLFLRWREARSLNEKFATFGGPQPNSIDSYVQGHHARERQRTDAVIETLNETLYELFGRRALDETRVDSAYARLADALAMPRKQTSDQWVIGVTTNYDPALEIGLSRVGFRVDPGFVAEGFGATPVFQPRGFVDRAMAERAVPILHLHGAVGWYQRDGNVVMEYADRPYDASFGLPVVLYPDPDKEPTRDALVSDLWTEFSNALDAATHVMVLGHSLHDAPLVEHLRKEGAKVGVIVYDQTSDPQQEPAAQTNAAMKAEITRVQKLLPEARLIPGRFGVDPTFSEKALDAWREQAPRASS